MLKGSVAGSLTRDTGNARRYRAKAEKKNRLVAEAIAQAENFMHEWAKFADDSMKPPSQLIRERAPDGQIMHSLFDLLRRLIKAGRLIEVIHAIGDYGWAHEFSEHLDPRFGPMPSFYKRGWLKRVKHAERGLYESNHTGFNQTRRVQAKARRKYHLRDREHSS